MGPLSSRRQFAQDLGEFDGARAPFCAIALKIDPAFVEIVRHTYAGFWMLHAFPAEPLLPLGARYFHRFHIASKSSSEGGRLIAWAVLLRTGKLDNPHAGPFLAQQIGRRAADILDAHHADLAVERLQVAPRFDRNARRQDPMRCSP